MTIDTYTELDALTVAAPNLAAVHMMAGLRGISFHEAMIAQAEEWATALDEAIAARPPRPRCTSVRANQPPTPTSAPPRSEATKHLDEAARLSNVRERARDCRWHARRHRHQPRRPHPRKPQIAKPLLAHKEKQPGRLLLGPVASRQQYEKTPWVTTTPPPSPRPLRPPLPASWCTQPGLGGHR